jgi:hypothetical protein
MRCEGNTTCAKVIAPRLNLVDGREGPRGGHPAAWRAHRIREFWRTRDWILSTHRARGGLHHLPWYGSFVASNAWQRQ